MPVFGGNVNQWLPYFFAVGLWLTYNPALAMIWAISYGLGLVPSHNIDFAMFATSLLAIAQKMLTVARARGKD